MPRDPFQFLDNMSQQNMLVHLLTAIIHKAGDELELTLDDLYAIDPADSFGRYPGSNKNTLMLRFAKKGAQLYFAEGTSQTTSPAPRSTRVQPAQEPERPRHAMHSDLDYLLREQELAEHAQATARRRQQEARAADGTLPWRTVKPQ
jgi:hypothetical protein